MGHMTLRELADQIDLSAGSPAQLRVALFNFVRGIEQGYNRSGFEHRLKEWLVEIRAEAAGLSIGAEQLHSILHHTLEEYVGDGHFLTTGRIVQSDLDCKAVSFCTEGALPFWLPIAADKLKNNPVEVRNCCELLKRRGYRPGQIAGKEWDAFWLTPLTGEVEVIVDRARELNQIGTWEHDSEYCEMAKDARNLLGLSQYGPPTIFFALITKKNIRELLVPEDGQDAGAHPLIMGPSILEGRCHGRWRHWSELYGRTFQLSPKRRAADCGVPEAVRKPLSLDEIEDFVYVGQLRLAAQDDDKDEDFARSIGAVQEVKDLLQSLHGLTGV
jgi:hypothetical protein